MNRKRNSPRKRTTKTYERTYDKSAKNIIATRQFLAMILHERVPEFQPFSRDAIERDCIEGTPWVEEIPVDPGRTNNKRPQIARKRRKFHLDLSHP